MWDTCGQERFQKMGAAFYQEVDCCIFVYDVTDPSSLKTLEFWKQEFMEETKCEDPDNFPFLVVGNKIDKEKNVTNERAKKWCLTYMFPLFETSATKNTNVREVFEAAARLTLAAENRKKIRPMANKKEPPARKKNPTKFLCKSLLVIVCIAVVIIAIYCQITLKRS